MAVVWEIPDEQTLKVTWPYGRCQDCGEPFDPDPRFPKQMVCYECRIYCPAQRLKAERERPRYHYQPGLLLRMAPEGWTYETLARNLFQKASIIKCWDGKGRIPTEYRLIKRLCRLYRLNSKEFEKHFKLNGGKEA